MKFAVGYQNNDLLIETIFKYKQGISELYFPYANFTSGRGISEDMAQCLHLESVLKRCSENGIKLNFLLNGNCYGRNSLGRKFYEKIGNTVDKLKTNFNLSIITTTSPVIAKFIKNNFADLECRASINMEIGTREGMEYLFDVFDSFYLKRELNYAVNEIEKLYAFCHKNGKTLHMLANSGCLNYCSARTFHDNLVAHQHEIDEMDNAFLFPAQCHMFLKNPEKMNKILSYTNFIRPENCSFYDQICDGMKLATRTNRNPAAVVEAYLSQHFSGNLLDLTEPSHAENCYPNVIENGKIDENYFAKRINCKRECDSCGLCEREQKSATVTLNNILNQ